MMRLKILAAASVAALALSGCATYEDDEVAGTVSSPTTERSAGNKSVVDAEAQANFQGRVTTVGGAEMDPDKTVVANAENSPIHTTLVAAIKAAGLVDTLSGPGPFTVFAPTDDAFALLSQADLKALMLPENKDRLLTTLTYHVVPGTYTADDLMELIQAGGGTAALTTVEGDPLTFSVENGFVKIGAGRNSGGYVTQADVMQSNGVMHVTNGVFLLPM